MTVCTDVLERLDRLADGSLPPAEAESVAAHLEGCAECRAESEWLRSLRDQVASLPREIKPSRDLWPGIGSRIGRRRTAVVRPLVVLAAAAGLLAAVGLGALLGARAVRSSPVASGAGVPGVVAASWRGTDTELERLRGQLEELIEMRRGSLDARALAVVEENLRIIDGAIERIELAVRHDPESRALRRLLYEARREEIRLLWRAAELPAES